MNGDLMKQYIEFVADRLLVALDQPKVYIIIDVCKCVIYCYALILLAVIFC